MSILVGEYPVVVDKQKRLTLPAKLRHILPSGENRLFFAAGAFPCIECYNTAEFKAYIAKNIEDKQNNPRTYYWLKRGIGAKAYEVDVDAQFRLTVPDGFKDHAQLGNLEKVMVVGCIDHIEIWNPELYNQGMAENMPNALETMLQEKHN